MTDIFLSVSFVDVEFVRTVHDRLPRGVARYFERSFERGEDLIAAMERGLEASGIFVLFASRAALKSYAVNFEIQEARSHLMFGKMQKVLVFPIEAGLTFGDLPAWMQRAWVPNAGESPADIARYLTTILLEPGRGMSVAAPNVVGRGATVDAVRRLAATHLQRHRESPRVLIFPGITGIGRRTFAAYYLRNGLAAEANLPFGPTIQLSAQAELVDLYRALRVEVDPGIRPSGLARDQEAFEALKQPAQIAEIMNVMKHFTQLRQAVTIVSAAGLFEDAATPKSWVKPLLQSVPTEQILVIVSNLQFRSEFVDELGVAIQLRMPELHSDDIRALVIFTASLLGLKDFNISAKLVSAIGGHPDVANAAVRLASQKGIAILERDPRQIFNIQRAIIGDAVMPDALKPTERLVLDVLGWLPSLGSDLLEKIIVDKLGKSADEFNSAIEGLILGCLIYATGYQLSIASSVRHLYRRHNVTSPETLKAMANVFAREWQQSADQGFRDDLFSAFVFMHLLEGKSLPVELRRLMTPSNLYEAVRDAYARGKTTEDRATIEQAIEWGKAAFEMNMTDSVREEILSTVARAQIRLSHFHDASDTIEEMRRRSYRQVVFLEGHLLRKRRRFDDAIPKFRFVLEHNRGHRAAVHELAICYRRLHKTRELEQLLKEHGDAVDDSAEFLDFSIALQISRGDLNSVPAAIERLRQMDDTSNRADLRHAQYLSKRAGDKGAFEYLSHVLKGNNRESIRLRAARAFYAARCGQTKIAREDLSMLKSIGESDTRARALEIHIFLAEGRPKEALAAVRKMTPEEPGDWLIRATVFEAMAAEPSIGLTERSAFKDEAQVIRARYSGDPGFVLDN
jgi:tetratricopeptide (TPR) repeat protein